MPRSKKKGPAGDTQQTETVDSASRVMPGKGASGIERPLDAEAVYVPDAETGAADTAPAEPINPYDVADMNELDIPEDLTPAQEAVLKLDTYYKWGSKNYHFPIGSGSVRVDTDAIRKTAAEGKEIMDELKELVQSMASYVADSDDYWKGEAGDWFREGFALGMKDLAHCLDDHEEYIRELIAYADKHEDVITQANAIANALEDVVWSDV